MKELVSSYLKLALIFGDKTFATVFVLSMFLFALFLMLFYAHRASFVVGQIKKICQYFTSNAMRNNKMLKRHWELYETTFLYDIDKRYKTTHTAREFFEPEKVLRDVVNIRLWLFLPYLLFLCGVFAVFMQLAYGFASFDISAPEAILDSIKNAFYSMSHGFVILAISIILTMTLLYAARSRVSRMTYRITALCDMLDTIFKISAMEERQIVLREYARIFTDTIRDVFTTKHGNAHATVASLSRETLDAARLESKLLASIIQNQVASEKRMNEAMARLGDKIGDYVGARISLGLEEIKHAVENGHGAKGGNGRAHPPHPQDGLLGAEIVQILKDANATIVS